MKKYHLRLIILFLCIFIACSKSDNSFDENGEGDTEMSGSKIELNEGITKLTQKQIENTVKAVEDSIIIFSGNIEESDLPQEGQILINLDRSAMFPYGFLGKVIQVLSDEGNYKVITESVPLDVAFKKLEINGTFDLIPIENPGTRAIKIFKDEEGFQCFKPLPHSFSIGDEEAGWNSSITLDALIGLKTISKGNIISDNFRTTILTKMNVLLGADFKLSAGNEITSPTVSIPLSPMSIFNPYLVVYLKSEFEGELGIKSSYNYEKVYVIDFELVNGNWGKGNYEYPDKGTSEFTAEDGFFINGSLFTGVVLELQLRAFTMKDVKIAANLTAGPRIKGSLDEESFEGEGIYNRLKDTYIDVALGIRANASVSAKIWGLGVEYQPWEAIDFSLFQHQYYIFPAFENMVADVNKDELSVNIKADVKRDLLFPVKVGFNLNNQDKTDSRISNRLLDYKSQDKKEFSLDENFQNLNENDVYYVNPIIISPLVNKQISASPLKSFDTKRESEGEIPAVLTGTWIWKDDDPAHAQIYTWSFIFKSDGTFLEVEEDFNQEENKWNKYTYTGTYNYNKIDGSCEIKYKDGWSMEGHVRGNEMIIKDLDNETEIFIRSSDNVE